MRRIIVAIGLLLAALGSAVAQTGTAKTKSALQTELNNCFPTQLTGAITPLGALNCYSDMLASWQQYPTVNAQVGVSYAFTANDYGKLVTFTNASPVAVSLSNPTATGFSPWNAYAANLGSGTVTITPATSTINGAATYTLATNNSVWIVSDGTNYQTWSGAGASVQSVANSDGTLTLTPTSGNVVASLALGHANLWTAAQTFGSHILAASTTPTISACGTGSPTVTGSDNYGTVVAGGGTLTTCSITFGKVWGTAPSCTQSSPTLTAMTSTSSTTLFTVGAASLTNATIKYVCGSTS